jgi:hypothetical protein
LPGVIFPLSVAFWIEYYLSVRASDDSPVPWHWYGSLLSACLNFPAFIYSAPVQLFRHSGFQLGRLWIGSRTVAFFIIVFVFWYWIGKAIEGWLTGHKQPASSPKLSGVRLAVIGIAAACWILIAVGVTFDGISLVWKCSWYYLRYLATDLELIQVAQWMWSVGLAIHYCRNFRDELRTRANMTAAQSNLSRSAS